MRLDFLSVDKASAASLACKTTNIVGVVAEVSADGTYPRAQSFAVRIPKERSEENASIYEDAARMEQPKRTVNLKKAGRHKPF
jgi:hypothetical protein